MEVACQEGNCLAALLARHFHPSRVAPAVLIDQVDLVFVRLLLNRLPHGRYDKVGSVRVVPWPQGLDEWPGRRGHPGPIGPTLIDPLSPHRPSKVMPIDCSLAPHSRGPSTAGRTA
eukprot:1302961-Pyramimonas_sp.AAC.1